ncbi:MAG: AbiV family abortive infection protein [Desulfobaccales bacterium]
MKANGDRFEKAIDACIKNGRRLLEDSEYMKDYDRLPTAKALAILAQEEFAKAYILRLVQEEAIPWCDEILRATKDHNCKHLMAMIMEYLFTPLDVSSLERDQKIKDNFPDFKLPRKVADALNIFCHEKVSRWKSSPWCWDEDPQYDSEARKVWKGQIDKTKQNAFYVSIGKNGSVTNDPMLDNEDVSKYIAYAKILEEVANFGDWLAFTEKEYIKSVLKLIFDGIYG